MLEIYFDGVLLDPINYMDLTQQWVMFDKEFKLGATPSRQFTLTIPKNQFNESTQDVKIVYMNNDYAYLVIDKVSYEEGGTIPKAKIILVDKMVKADFYYDASELCPTNLKTILLDICSKMGVELGNEHFDNEDIEVDFWDSTITAREYLSYISEMAGGYARIESDGKLWIRKFDNQNATTIDAGLCEQIILGQKHKIERVVFDNGLVKYQKARTSRNILFTDFNAWESGHYSMTDGTKQASNTRLRLKDLTPVQPSTTYYAKIELLDIVLREYDSNGNFIRSLGGLNCRTNGATFTTSANARYIGVALYDAPTSGEYANYVYFEHYWNDFKPIICLNSETNKSYEDYDLSNDDTLETVYLNPVNVYCNNQENFNVVADDIIGFEYYNLDTGKTYIINNSMCGDVLNLSYEGHNYYTINNTPDLKFMGVWQGSYVFNVESQAQAETQVRGVSTQVKAIKIKQNRDENILTIVVEDIKTQKDTINPQLEDKITANTTLISQTASEIRNEVSASESTLQGNIDNVAGDLADADSRLSGLIHDNTTLIQQIATAIISTIRSTGGSNLLRNSVGYSGTDFWTSTGTVETNQDDTMSLSGSEFILTGASTLSQAYNTQPGVSYSVSCKIKHKAVGTANQVKIELLGQGGTSKVILDTSEVFNDWHDVVIAEPYTATITNPTIKITCTGDDTLEITDLIIAVGDNQVWSGYFDEVYGKEHKLDRNGLRLSNLAGHTASKTTSNSIQMLEGETVVAELSKRVVKSDTGVITNSFTIGQLQTVVLDANNIIEYI